VSRELLLANHRFPGEYIYKVFGPGTDAFRSDVHAAAAAAGGAEHVRSSERATRSASRICITLAIHVQTVDEVLALYRTLAEVDGVLMLL
jgi:putative lipoic acid-binding regulatory protein